HGPQIAVFTREIMIHEKKQNPSAPSSHPQTEGHADGAGDFATQERASDDADANDLDEHDLDELEPLPRARVWLVDGYNVLHCAPFRKQTGGPDAPPGDPRTRQKPFWSASMRERLVAVAGGFPDRDAEIWLVFDGSHPPETPLRGTAPRLIVEFAPSADDWIVRRVRDAEDTDEIAVVSGDRRLTGKTRHRGAAVVSPRHFLQHCFAEVQTHGVEPGEAVHIDKYEDSD
ncbi:MAG: NYN domain-containing protein, partial [Myxococcota bacterium]